MSEHPWRRGEGKIKTDPKELLEMDWEEEDVNHVEEIIRMEHASSPGLLALPGLEHVRNMIAARVGMEVYPQGHFKEEESD